MSIYEGLTKPNDNLKNYLRHQVGYQRDYSQYHMNTADEGLIATIKKTVRTLIAPVNPFHPQQAPTKQGYAYLDAKDGTLSMKLPPYPFKQIYNLGKPEHFDMTKELERDIDHGTDKYYHPSIANDKLMTFAEARVPHICEVNKKKFEVCKLVNGESKCSEEGDRFLEQCPSFALNIYRQNKLFNENVKSIQRKEYQDAMKIESYNKGRTVRDVNANAKYSDGSAHNLRPDSMWADDRYSNVTQADVNSARERVLAKYGPVDYTKLKTPKSHAPDRVEYHQHHRLY